jgi:dienelactone hydrolase
LIWDLIIKKDLEDLENVIEQKNCERKVNLDLSVTLKIKILLLGFGIAINTGCGVNDVELELLATNTQTDTATTQPTRTSLPATQTDTPTLPATATLTSTPEPTSTTDPLSKYTIEHLSSRSYGGGELKIEETLEDNAYFTRYLFSYPSDGLTIYGFMNLPKQGTPPFPVVIASHGYINPTVYNTIDYTTRYADSLSISGYLVLHPNLRGYPPSDEGDNLFRVGMAVDVLNLIAIVQKTGGRSDFLGSADPTRIGLWGHSMGGGVSLRVIVVNPDVNAAILYGSMSGDERQNFEAILEWSEGERGNAELSVPDKDLSRISPIFHLERIQAAVAVHHGEADDTVPLEWSLDFCEILDVLGKTIECYTYPGQPHTFRGEGEQLFMHRAVDFFDTYVKDK